MRTQSLLARDDSHFYLGHNPPKVLCFSFKHRRVALGGSSNLVIMVSLDVLSKWDEPPSMMTGDTPMLCCNPMFGMTEEA